MEMNNETLQKSLLLAANHYNGKYRKVAVNNHRIPYFYHVVQVHQMIWWWGIGDIHHAQAALYHDVLEECPEVTLEDLKKEITPAACAMVKELTFYPPSNPIEAKLAKENYIASFSEKFLGSLVIKVADRFCNTKDFLLTDSKYANIYYYKKAAALLQTLDKRKDEIIEEYGVMTWNRMASSQRTLEAMLAGVISYTMPC